MFTIDSNAVFIQTHMLQKALWLNFRMSEYETNRGFSIMTSIIGAFQKLPI